MSYDKLIKAMARVRTHQTAAERAADQLRAHVDARENTLPEALGTVRAAHEAGVAGGPLGHRLHVTLLGEGDACRRARRSLAKP
jgi:hypothetical protein